MYLLYIIITLLFSSCATIINGPDQKISITSEPAGADIAINGVEAGKTPATFRIIRAKDHIITLSKEGYHVHNEELTRQISSVSVLYLLPGGLVSAAVDAAQDNGAIYCFKDKVAIELKPLFDPETVIVQQFQLLRNLQELDIKNKG